MVEILSRGTVRGALNQTDESLLAYTTLPYFTTNNESELSHRFDYDVNPNNTIPFPPIAVFSTCGTKLDRRELEQDSGLLAYLCIQVFSSNGVPAQRIALPVISDIDDCQIIVRGGSFVIDFSGDPLKGLPPHGVQFENNSQSPVERYTWDFGDGESSSEKHPFHIYLEEGTYTVKLTAGYSTFGYSSLTKTDYIDVRVKLIINPMSGSAPLKVEFGIDESYLN